ncbi:ArsR/SmtB family transcription factor [Anaerotalea alkaliphila]|uniref:Helix-turn-helix domain-containing protein n=1 Tax=Anaerotalea alkaliphila TaxID=2662126 RepID=A0A7X5HUW5_9FIRM|nr:ArsR family transcriptional regulator [Anaerotalea alkaliphila]NDL67074.1 helix-turn-helix domain-containing protein [Anaerotalea alkaliphila]
MQTIKMNLDDKGRLAAIAKALSVDARIEILRQLRHRELNVNEIAEILGIPPSSAAAHVKVLEEAGIIRTNLQPGIRGSMKMCRVVLDHVYVELDTTGNLERQEEVVRMPIGAYVDCRAHPTCGMAGARGPIGREDDPGSFYLPERLEAKLLWVGHGHLEYRFPAQRLEGKGVESLEVSMELCSEDHEYNLDHPSDITLWVNGFEAGTWTCPGDLGGRRGLLNPEWWPDKNTQYGILKTWKLTVNGCFVDGEQGSDRKISDFGLEGGDYITVRIGVKEEAVHKGGFNLFGDCFGDHAQNIVMKIGYAAS